MYRDYAPHASYKDSGVGWLADIPTHWGVRRLKYLATVNDEALAEATDPNMEIAYVDIGNVDSVEGITGREDLVFEDAPSRARRIVRQGDVIISTVRTYLRAIARIEAADATIIVSTGFAVIRPRHLDEGFMAYALRAPYFVERVVDHSVGVSYPAINASDLACLDIVFAPLPEQRAIAAFLDRETAKTDALIAKKVRLIELLQEKRTALVSRAVTRGLNPNVPMKDSGVEWLGEIPAHWEVGPIWTLFELGRGRVISHEDIQSNPGPYPVFSSQTEAEGIMGYISTYDFEGDYLTWTTDGAKAGSVFSRNGRFNCTNVCGTLLPCQPRSTNNTFFREALNLATSSHIRYDINPKLMNDVMARIRLQLPPLQEQTAIAKFLDQETAKLDALIAKIHEAIERLKELRAALISAAVTGRIDVREEAA